MLPHPAAPNATDRCGTVLPQQNQWTNNSTTATDVGTEEVLTAGMQQWARCLADVIHSHSGAKVFIEQEAAALVPLPSCAVASWLSLHEGTRIPQG